MTPLDIRLTISAQFRLLSIICASAMTGVGKAADKANKGKLVSAEVLSNHSFTVQMDIFFNKLLATLEVVIKASRGFKLIMHILVQSRIYSALHTDVFITSKPDSNQYSVINNYYPLHDNASFTNVRYLVFFIFFINISFRIWKMILAIVIPSIDIHIKQEFIHGLLNHDHFNR